MIIMAVVMQFYSPAVTVEMPLGTPEVVKVVQDTPKAPPERAYRQITAKITGYNTVPEQTDSTPCLAASGKDICGRTDAVACPRSIKLGTVVEIAGKKYICEDRTASKYNDRFDISCDKDRSCPGKVTGRKEVKIYLE